MNTQPNRNSSSLKQKITNERLRQARLSFNLAITIVVISFSVNLLGIGLLFFNKIPSGTITTTTGLVSSVRCLKFARETNDRLDQILNEESEKKWGLSVK